MRFILLAFLLLSSLNASKILSYNIYDRTDRADVMITFDTPYEGVIKQNISKNRIIIKLQDASIESAKIKKIASKYLHSLTITPMANQTQITASVPSGVRLIASKTADAYGLRLRFTTKTATKKHTTNTQNNTNPLANLPTKKGDDLSTSYYIVVTILVIGIIILYIIRKKMVAKGIDPNQKSPWLFQENAKESSTAPAQKQNVASEPVSIRFHKNINNSANVVMLDFSEYSYLVLLAPNNAVLLDKFVDNKPNTQEDFEMILQNNYQKLDTILQVESQQTSASSTTQGFTSKQEALQAYTQRAGAISE